MPDINITVLTGRLGRDPELRTTSSGKSCVNFSIAVSRGFKGSDGKFGTDWINIVAWEKTADMVTKYCSKGSRIGVEGRIQVRTYQTQDGSNRTVTEVVAEKINFIDSKGQSGGQQQHSNNQAQPQDDDLPS